jgi:hypothetical protein
MGNRGHASDQGALFGRTDPSRRHQRNTVPDANAMNRLDGEPVTRTAWCTAVCRNLAFRYYQPESAMLRLLT